MVRKQPKYIRRFNGKEFVLLRDNLSFKSAQIKKGKVKSMGKKARVTSMRGRYNLYGRK